ncbi:anaerobic cobaltochelatase [Selenomonas ruminantium]|uniref:Anaerobic cobaltochelatase n=1 Tax=Selenomonas ruminantium TaxID=971 RepID=A0A1M6UFA6_SELRU|nr:sirohydrochlorin cobaltochelatase [Selenomonas ruminantium]SHK67841.1 anaerobic cobaltochelatase [Selenomonas ruminantium]
MKKAILFASFGVANEQARHSCIDAAAQRLQAAYPDVEVRQAYTSVFIKKKLAAQGIHVDSLPEALERLLADGFTHVVIQPGYLTAGEEYEKKVIQVATGFQQRFVQLGVSRPIMEKNADGADVLAAVQEMFSLSHDEELVLVGHGSPHQHNPAYENLQDLADKTGFPLHVGVIEPTDTPSFADVLARLEGKGVRKVLLAPLLLSGGSHVSEDIAGDEPESWLCRLQAAGITVRTRLKGMGEYPVFQDLYVKRLQEWEWD